MSATARTRLKSLRLDFISLVDAGDNPAAHVQLLKRRKPVRKGLQEYMATREELNALDRLSWGFSDYVGSIVRSDKSPEDKRAAMLAAADEFAAMLSALAGQAADAVAAEGEAGSDETTEKRVLAWAADAIQKARNFMPAPTGQRDAGVAKVDLGAIPEAQRPAVEALAKRADESASQVAELAKARDAEKARADAAEEALSKAAPDPYRGLEKAAADELRKRDDRIAALEALNAEGAAVAKARADGLDAVPGTTVEKLGPMLLRVEKGRSTAEDAAEIARLLKAGSEALRLAGVTKALGVGSDDTNAGRDDAAGDVAKRAHALVADGKAPNVAKAMEMVIAADTDLRKRLAERQHASAAA